MFVEFGEDVIKKKKVVCCWGAENLYIYVSLSVMVTCADSLFEG